VLFHGFKQPTSKGERGREERGKGGKEELKEREGKGRWREGFGPPKNVGVAPPMA